MGWLVAAGMVFMLVGGFYGMKVLKDRELERNTAGLRAAAEELGLQLGANGHGLLGGARGRVGGAQVDLRVFPGGHLPQVDVRHPGVPATLTLDKRERPPGFERLDDANQTFLDHWQRAYGFQIKEGVLTLYWKGDLAEIPARTREMVHLADGIAALE